MQSNAQVPEEIVGHLLSELGGAHACHVSAWIHAKLISSDQIHLALQFAPILVWNYLLRESCNARAPAITAVMVTAYSKFKQGRNAATKERARGLDEPSPYHLVGGGGEGVPTEIPEEILPEISGIGAGSSMMLVCAMIGLFVDRMDQMKDQAIEDFCIVVGKYGEFCDLCGLIFLYRLCGSGAWTASVPQEIVDCAMKNGRNWNFLPGSEQSNYKFNLSLNLYEEMVRGIRFCL
jgi:hypothetical protein